MAGVRTTEGELDPSTRKPEPVIVTDAPDAPRHATPPLLSVVTTGGAATSTVSAVEEEQLAGAGLATVA